MAGVKEKKPLCKCAVCGNAIPGMYPTYSHVQYTCKNCNVEHTLRKMEDFKEGDIVEFVCDHLYYKKGDRATVKASDAHFTPIPGREGWGIHYLTIVPDNRSVKNYEEEDFVHNLAVTKVRVPGEESDDRS